MSVDLVLNGISQSIFDKKGMNILVLDVREYHLDMDYVVIAEGHVERHVIAIGEAISKFMEEMGWIPSFFSGFQTGDWVVLDYMEIVIHLFIPELRDRYRLESLWNKSEIVNVTIDVFA